MADEEFIQTYLNKLGNRVNELQQENLLLKAQLEHTNTKLQLLTQNSLPVDTPNGEEVEETDSLPIVKKVPSEDFPKGKRESLGDRIRRENRGE